MPLYTQILPPLVHHPPPPTHCLAVEPHAGDTFTKTFEIKGIRNTSDKGRSTYDFTCRLVNQRGKVCMECDRTTMFPFFAPPSPSDPPATPQEQLPPKPADKLRDHVVKQSEKLGEACAGFGFGAAAAARLRGTRGRP